MKSIAKTILLVEDEALIALDEAKQLRKEGYKVVHAYNGEEAIAKVRASNPPIDLILMDINLGKGMDGTEAAQIILQRHDIPVVFLSSHTGSEIVAKTEKITSYGYVVKNTGLTVLDASIKMAFKLHDAHRIIQRTNESLLLSQAASRSGTWDWDIVNNSFNWSAGFMTLFGMSEETAAGFEVWRKTIHPEDREIADQKIQQSIDTKTDLLIDYRIVLPGGEIRWIRAKGKTFYDNDRPLRMIGICLDITEQKQVEVEIRLQRNLLETVINHLPAAVNIVRASDLRILVVNPEYQLFAPGKKMIGKTIEEVWPEVPGLTKIFRDVAETGKPYFETDTPYKIKRSESGALEEAYFTWSLFRIQLPGNGGWGLLNSAWETTQRKKTEEALKQNQELYRSLVENTTAIILRLDPQGIIHFANQRALDFFGYSKEELIGKHVFDTIISTSESTGRDLTGMVNAILANPDRFHSNANENSRKNGEKVWMEWTNSGIYDKEGNLSEILSVGIDLTDRMKVEQALKESEKKFRAIFEQSNIGKVLVDVEGKIIETNQAFANMLGYPASEFQGLELSRITHNDDVPLINEIVRKTKSGELSNSRHENRYIDKAGNIVWADTSFAVIYNADGSTVYSILSIINNTEKKKVQEDLQNSEMRYRMLHESLRDAFVQVTMDGRIIEFNDLYCRMLGYTGEEIKSLTYKDLTPERWHKFEERIVHEQIIPRGYSDVYEKEYRHKDGAIFPVELRTILSNHGQSRTMWAIVRDISERKRSEEALQKALSEKETLMQELQHRVKNSLGTAISLISLEQENLTNNKLNSVLLNVKTRLHTISSLYDQLNHSSKPDQINLQNYLQTLITSLTQAYLEDESRIKIETSISPLIIDSKRAMPIGLIVNELLINALKYAFPSGKKGIILVELAESDKKIKLNVTDNGVGLKSSGTDGNSSKLGLKLVEILTEQLSGKIKIDGKNGVSATLSFSR